MKRTLIVLAIISFWLLPVRAQTKIDDYAQTDSDSEAARLDTLFVQLQNQPSSTGLIIVYSGDKKERLGNITPLVRGIETYTRFRGFDVGRLSIKIAEGKRSLDREFWLVPNGIKPPEVKSTEIEFGDLKGPLLYAEVCVDCEPAVPGLDSFSIDLELLSDILLRNSQLKLLLEVSPTSYSGWRKDRALSDAKQYAAAKSKYMASRKIAKDRLSVRVTKAPEQETLLMAKYYLLPANDRAKQKN